MTNHDLRNLEMLDAALRTAVFAAECVGDAALAGELAHRRRAVLSRVQAEHQRRNHTTTQPRPSTDAA